MFVVGSPPELLEGLKDTTSLASESAVLSCTIAPGDPKAQILWFFKDKEVTKDKRHTVAYKENMASLTVKDADLRDTGAYRCEASNKLGRVETQCVLTVNST